MTRGKGDPTIVYGKTENREDDPKAEPMTYAKKKTPLFSESEIDAHIGPRAYLYYFQDLSAQHFASFGKGNDRVPYEYGICWILSKYHVKVFERAAFNEELEMETWLEPSRSPVRLQPNLRITCGGKTYAAGQMELCLANVENQKLERLSAIEFPDDVAEHCDADVPRVRKLRMDGEGMQRAYTYTVRYSDLDNNRHMNNLHYIDLVENVFDSGFYAEHPISEMELEYVNQCHEGDQVDVLFKLADGGAAADVLAVRPDGQVALKSVLTFAK